MDSSAYLTKQGWRGKGHSLHPSGRGIKKPVLVSKKDNAFGIGKKKTDVHADQWWSRAFDSGLKSLKIGKEHSANDEKRELSTLHSLVQSNKQGITKWSGLYGSFVKGDTLRGTFSESSAQKRHSISRQGPKDEVPEPDAASNSVKQRKKHKRQRERIESDNETPPNADYKSKRTSKRKKRPKSSKLPKALAG